jgi:hypothetical protein
MCWVIFLLSPPLGKAVLEPAGTVAAAAKQADGLVRVDAVRSAAVGHDLAIFRE